MTSFVASLSGVSLGHLAFLQSQAQVPVLSQFCKSLYPVHTTSGPLTSKVTKLSALVVLSVKWGFIYVPIYSFMGTLLPRLDILE